MKALMNYLAALSIAEVVLSLVISVDIIEKLRDKLADDYSPYPK